MVDQAGLGRLFQSGCSTGFDKGAALFHEKLVYGLGHKEYNGWCHHDCDKTDEQGPEGQGHEDSGGQDDGQTASSWGRCWKQRCASACYFADSGRFAGHRREALEYDFLTGPGRW